VLHAPAGRFDAVTGSTHAGMIAGFAALEDAGGPKRRVIGIDASATLDKTRDQVSRIARHTAALIGLERDLREDEIILLTAGQATSTAFRCSPQSTPSACRGARSNDHRPDI
jgi:hypothetical protein